MISRRDTDFAEKNKRTELRLRIYCKDLWVYWCIFRQILSSYTGAIWYVVRNLVRLGYEYAFWNDSIWDGDFNDPVR